MGRLSDSAATGGMKFYFTAHDTYARRDLKLIFQSSGSRTLAIHNLKT